MLIYVLHYVVLVASWAWFDRSRSSSCDGEGGVKTSSLYIYIHMIIHVQIGNKYTLSIFESCEHLTPWSRKVMKSLCVWVKAVCFEVRGRCSATAVRVPVWCFRSRSKAWADSTCSLGCQAPTATRWFHAICVQSLNIFNAIAWYICFLPTFVLFVMSCYDHRPRVACPSRHFVPFLYIASIVLSSLRFGKDARPSEGCAVNDENHLERTTVDP